MFVELQLSSVGSGLVRTVIQIYSTGRLYAYYKFMISIREC